MADWLSRRLKNPAIDRLVKTGAKDRGDIGGVHTMAGGLVAIECKNTTRLNLPGWTQEAAAEAEHYGALVGVVVHKRHGTTDPAAQWGTMTASDFVTLISGGADDDQ